MRERRLVRFLQLACAGLAVSIVYELVDTTGGFSDPPATIEGVGRIDPPGAPGTSGAPDSAGGEAAAGKRLARIVASGIFGVPPARDEPGLPVLIGLARGAAGSYAILRAAGGAGFELREGEAKDGVRLISIGTNRAIVEYGAEQHELSLFSGLGSPPLLPPRERNEPHHE
jgi:hypothetical protein